MRRTVELHERLGRACYQHRHADLEPLARQIYDADRLAYGDDAPATLTDLRVIANMLSWSGQPARGVVAGEAALARYERVYGPDGRETAVAWKNLGDLLADAERPGDAADAYARASKIYRDGAGTTRQYDRELTCSLAAGYRRLGLYEDAEPLLLDCRVGREAPRAQLQASDFDAVGDFYFEYGNYPMALRYYRACYAAWQTTYATAGGDEACLYRAPGVEVRTAAAAHAFYAVAPPCLENLIDASERIDDEEGARALRQWQRDAWRDADTAEIERRLQRDIERELASDWFTPAAAAHRHEALGFLYDKKGRYDDAGRELEQAHRFQQSNWSLLSSPERAHELAARLDGLLLRGDAAAAAGDRARAEDSYRSFATLAAQGLVPRHRWHMEGQARLARLYERTGRLEEAVAAWDRYLALVAAARGNDHLDYAWGLMQEARAYDALGKRRLARQARGRASAIRRAQRPLLDAAAEAAVPAALQSDRALAKEPFD